MNDINFVVLMLLWAVGWLLSIYIGEKSKRKLLWIAYMFFSVAIALIYLILRTLIIGTNQLRLMQINPNDLDPVSHLIFGSAFLVLAIAGVILGLRKFKN